MKLLKHFETCLGNQFTNPSLTPHPRHQSQKVHHQPRQIRQRSPRRQTRREMKTESREVVQKAPLRNPPRLRPVALSPHRPLIISPATAAAPQRQLVGMT